MVGKKNDCVKFIRGDNIMGNRVTSGVLIVLVFIVIFFSGCRQSSEVKKIGVSTTTDTHSTSSSGNSITSIDGFMSDNKTSRYHSIIVGSENRHIYKDKPNIISYFTDYTELRWFNREIPETYGEVDKTIVVPLASDVNIGTGVANKGDSIVHHSVEFGINSKYVIGYKVFETVNTLEEAADCAMVDYVKSVRNDITKHESFNVETLAENYDKEKVIVNGREMYYCTLHCNSKESEDDESKPGLFIEVYVSIVEGRVYYIGGHAWSDYYADVDVDWFKDLKDDMSKRLKFMAYYTKIVDEKHVKR